MPFPLVCIFIIPHHEEVIPFLPYFYMVLIQILGFPQTLHLPASLNLVNSENLVKHHQVQLQPTLFF